MFFQNHYACYAVFLTAGVIQYENEYPFSEMRFLSLLRCSRKDNCLVILNMLKVKCDHNFGEVYLTGYIVDV